MYVSDWITSTIARKKERNEVLLFNEIQFYIYFTRCKVTLVECFVFYD